MEVVGKALAYLCIQQVAKNDPERVPDLLSKVKFLESIGITQAEAALILGSTANSVAVLQSRKKRGAKGGKKSKR
jgi:hypothetical protein